MKIGIIPENLVERLAPALGLVPAPAIEAWFSFMLARPGGRDLRHSTTPQRRARNQEPSGLARDRTGAVSKSIRPTQLLVATLPTLLWYSTIPKASEKPRTKSEPRVLLDFLNRIDRSTAG